MKDEHRSRQAARLHGERAGRAEDPSAVAIDTQSIRAANHDPAATTGKEARKKVPGRKRGLAVDTLGLIIAVVVTAVSVTDNAIGIRLLDQVALHTPSVTVAWVDAGFKQDVGVHGEDPPVHLDTRLGLIGEREIDAVVTAGKPPQSPGAGDFDVVTR